MIRFATTVSFANHQVSQVEMRNQSGISHSILNKIKSLVYGETLLVQGSARAAMTEVANDAKAVKGLGNFTKWVGYTGGGINALISTTQMFNSKGIDAIIHGVDAGMSIIGATNPYGFGLSLYYDHVMKNYPDIQNSVNQQAIDRADLIKKGYIPVWHPGFPGK